MNMIEVKNLTKKFNDFVAVKNISFEVSAGEIFAFLGPNGAGKSTTIKMLTTLLKPTDGEIKLDNHDPAKNPNDVRHAFGIVFQDPSLDDELTAYENMEFHGVLYGLPKKNTQRKNRATFKICGVMGKKKQLGKRVFRGNEKTPGNSTRSFASPQGNIFG